MNLLKNLLPGICLACLSMYQPAIGQSSQELTDAAWRSDLKYYQHLIHTKYPNLFYNITAAQFDSAVSVIDKKIGKISDIQMNIEFAKLTAMFRIGHTALRQSSGEGNHLIGWTHQIPARFYLFSDGLYIKSIDSKYKEAVGGKVIKIGNTDAAVALQKIRPFIAYENEQGFKNMIQRYLHLSDFLQAAGISENADKVSVTYSKRGKESTIILPAEEVKAQQGHGRDMSTVGFADAYEGLNTPSAPLWLKEPNKLRYFEYLPATKTLYVKHGAVQDDPNETIAAFFERVLKFVDENDVDKFVLDIRLNGGGNNYLNKSVITGIIASRKINRNGHFFVVTGRATFSAAQNLTNELEKYTEAIFVGEPTSENVNFFGDTRTEILPNSKLNVALSWLWWQNQDPRDKRQWTAPQLAVDLSFEDYRKGIDPAMNAIETYKGQGNITDKLTNMVIAGKYDEAVTMAKSYVDDPLHRYYKSDLENKINSYGYSLMNQDKITEANKVLLMNVQLFPGSANAYDSYAESLLKLGKKDEAIKYYNIAISKDPASPAAESSRNALKQIEKDKKGF